MLRAVLHFIAGLFFRFFSKLHVEGLENVPGEGAAILASNHLALFDAPLIFAVIARKDLVALVADTYQKNLWIRPLVEATHGIWINRDGLDLHALRAARAHLQHGGLLGIAPEGTRSRTGALTRAKTGAAYLAEKADIPIVPIAIWGTETAVAQMTRLRRPIINIHFGAPFRLPPLERSDRSEALQINTDEIMLRIAAMLPAEYHGAYRNRFKQE